MGATKIISSDSHIIEPPNLWQERMPKSFGDRVPRLGKGEEADADTLAALFARSVDLSRLLEQGTEVRARHES